MPPLEKVLKEIRKQSGYLFLYNNELLGKAKPVTVKIKDASLVQALEQCFKGQPLTYSLMENTIVIKAREEVKAVSLPKAADIQIKGQVQDEKGDPLPGVSINVKGTSTGTISDVSGGYRLEVPDDKAILVFSFIGYITKEVAVNGRTTVDVKLDTDVKALEEVIVVGYGTQKKVNLTGAVSSVEGKDLLKAPATNITNVLAGRLPGLIAVNGNGKPGSGSSISIRGASTFGDNSALVVVDGIVRTFDQIDPNEVESISILKDASATAVYGSRAANGVVLVTTIRGASGKPTFNYNGFAGIQQPTRYPKVLNGYQYAVTKNQALKNLGKPLQYTDQQLEDIRTGLIPEFDWYGQTLKNQSFQTQQNLSVNGGSEAIKYFLSLGYLDQDGMYDGINFQRYSIRTNVDARINNNLTLSADIDASTRNTNESAYSPEAIFDDIVAAYPLDKAYNPDGTIFYTREQHPVEEIKTGYNRRKNRG